MSAWLSNTVIDLKLTFRDRQALFWNYLLPLFFLSLGFIVASVAESVKVALVMANVLFYPLMFLGGATLPVQMLSPSLRKVSRLLPSNFLVEGLGRIMVDGDGLGNTLVHLAV